MSIQITQRASSMADLADYLQSQADKRREQSKHAPFARQRRALESEAYGIEFAAEIVRSTTIEADAQ